MRQFHHIGIPVGEKTPDMVYYESIKCWATDPDSTPDLDPYRLRPLGPTLGAPGRRVTSPRLLPDAPPEPPPTAAQRVSSVHRLYTYRRW